MTPTLHTPTQSTTPVGPAERWSRASGVAVTALLIFAGTQAPDPPMHGGTDAMILAHYRAHHDGILAGVFVWAVAMMALLLFAAAVARGSQRAREAAGRGAGLLPTFTLLAAAAAAGMLLASQACTGAAAVVGHHAADTVVVRGLDEIAHMLAHLSMVPLGVLVLAMGLTIADARLGSRAVARVGAVLGAGLTVTASWVFVGGTQLHLIGVLCLFAVLLWWVVQSVVLVLAERAPRTRAGLVPRAEPLSV
jgi:hypothetical protein